MFRGLLLQLLLLLPAATAVSSGSKHLHSKACPSLFMIGAQKCGTTTFDGLLKAVFPEIANSARKEYHAFDTLTPPFDPSQLLQQYARGVKRPWKDGTHMTIYDGTPAYLRDPKVPQRMAAFCSFAAPPKFVVLLCDPVRRLFSGFSMDSGRSLGLQRLRNSEKLSNNTFLGDSFHRCMSKEVPAIRECLEELGYERCGDLLYGSSRPGNARVPGRTTGQDALGREAPCSGHLYSSLFSEQLEHWVSFFPRESFLVLEREQWSLDPWEAVKAVAEHFGLREPKRRPRALEKGYAMANVGKFHATSKPREETVELLRGFFRERDAWRGWLRHLPPPADSVGHEDVDEGYGEDDDDEEEDGEDDDDDEEEEEDGDDDGDDDDDDGGGDEGAVEGR